MKNVEEFLAKLDRVTFTKVDGHKLIGDAMGNDVEVSIHAEFMNNHHDLKVMPIQAQIRVRINGKHATVWGASDAQENTAIVTWFQESKAKAYADEYALEKADKNDAKTLFDNNFRTV